jgi:excisionase family DNA binding protein
MPQSKSVTKHGKTKENQIYRGSQQESKMRLLTIPEASERLGLKPSTMRFWIWTRKIEHVKVGRAVRLSEDTIHQVIQRGTVPARRS